MKADIQQLLKEMSGELQQLQEQMGNRPQPQGMAGTGTSADLYDPKSGLEQTRGTRSTPIQLQVDNQATSGTRRGTGVGEASTEIDDAQPQQQAGSAQLSDKQGEATGSGSRQRIPPEYRPVFERLSHRDGQDATSTTTSNSTSKQP